MPKRLRPKLSFANVVSCLALFVALGSGAYAAKQLPKNSVGSPQIMKNAVKTGDIARNAVKVGKLAKEAVKAGKLAKNAVPTNRLRNDAVSGTKIRNGAVDSAKVEDGSLTGADIDQASLDNVRAGNVTAIAITADESCSPVRPLASGVTSSRRNTGSCLLTFPNSISDCTANVTVHSRPTGLFLVAQRTAQTITNSSAPNVMVVDTLREEALSNLAFDLVLVC